MRLTFIFLSIAYILSQFFRSFLTVISENLSTDLYATPDDLAFSLGLWFLFFAIMQIPVGWFLDKYGPRYLILFLLGIIGSIGIMTVSLAEKVYHLHLGMTFIGIGFSPVLMTSYFIFAKKFEVSKFSTMASIISGVGSFGLLVGSFPLTYSTELIGWRYTLIILSFINFFISIIIFLCLDKSLPNDNKVNRFSDLFKIFKVKKIWFIFPLVLMCYAPVSGLRGVWLGPYFINKFNVSALEIGKISFLMSSFMIMGIFLYGPLERVFKSRKWIVLFGNSICLVSLFFLVLNTNNYFFSLALFLIVGFFGMSFPVIVAHGKSFIPSELTGRGLTILNLFAILGAGLTQLLSSYAYDYFSNTLSNNDLIFNYVFLIYFILLLICLLIYFFSSDNLD